MRTFTAETVGKSQFFISSFFQTFFIPTEKRSSALGKDHTLSLGFTLGLNHSMELTILAVPYQDDQQHVWGPPGDTQIGLKATLPVRLGAIATGVRGYVSIPTAKNHNVRFEPYSSDKVGAGLVGIVTADMTESFPLVPLKLNFNFGYMDHSLNGNFFIDEEDQFILGAGLKFPIRSFILYTEYSGEVFANNAAITYAENSTRITQGLKFLGPWNMIFDCAVDIGLDQPLSPEQRASIYQKDYADWKVILGVNYQASFGSRNSQAKKAAKKAEDKQLQQELETIRRTREGAQDTLQDMENSLQEKKPKDGEKP